MPRSLFSFFSLVLFLSTANCEETERALRTALDLDELSAPFASHDWFLDAIPSKDLLQQFDAGQPFSYRSVSEKCLESLLILSLGTNSTQGWAMLMRDSLGRPMAGLYQGAFLLLGSYDECISPKTYPTQWNATSDHRLLHDFSGKYCTLNWYNKLIDNFFSVGACVPSTCSKEDLTELFNETIPDTESRTYHGAVCPVDKSVGDDASAIFATVFFSVFGVFLIVVTIIDWRVKTRNKTCEKKGGPSQTEEGQVTETSLTHHRDDAPKITETSPNETEDDAGRPPKAGNPLNDEALSGDASNVNVEGNAQVDPEHATESKVKKPTGKRQGRAYQALVSFSLYATLPRIFSMDSPPGTFTCMNGIRFLSFSWIVLGHTWQLGLYLTQRYVHAAENYFGQAEIRGTYQHHAVNSMSLAVESFFLMSGSLVTISYMKTLKRQQDRCNCKQIALYYFHRYWRLTPAYLVIIMGFACYSNVIGSGPNFPTPFLEAEGCRYNWWTNLLYINNILGRDKMCMSWSWYLACDFQFYIAVPFFVFMMYRWPRVGMSILGAAYVLYLVTSGVLLYFVFSGKLDYFGAYYFPPFTRSGPYLIGILLGYIMFKTQCKSKLRKGVVVTCWIVAFILIYYSVYTFPIPSVVGNAVFYSLQRSMFSAGVAWVIFACCSGYGGFINGFLSLRIFTPLARITYIGYLFHPIIMYTFTYSSVRLIYVNVPNMVMFYGGYLLYTVVISFVIKACFEEPFMLLERAILPKKND